MKACPEAHGGCRTLQNTDVLRFQLLIQLRVFRLLKRLGHMRQNEPALFKNHVAHDGVHERQLARRRQNEQRFVPARRRGIRMRGNIDPISAIGAEGGALDKPSSTFTAKHPAPHISFSAARYEAVRLYGFSITHEYPMAKTFQKSPDPSPSCRLSIE
jgi:hypothetical protein